MLSKRNKSILFIYYVISLYIVFVYIGNKLGITAFKGIFLNDLKIYHLKHCTAYIFLPNFEIAHNNAFNISDFFLFIKKQKYASDINVIAFFA